MAGRSRNVVVTLAAGLALVLAPAVPALADEGAWTLSEISTPTNLLPERSGGEVVLTAQNLGDVTARGSRQPITVSVGLAGLPAGAEPEGIEAFVDEFNAGIGPLKFESGTQVSCVQPAGPCTYSEDVPPGEGIRVGLRIKTGRTQGTGTVTASVQGGGLETATVSEPLTVSSAPSSFGLEPGGLIAKFTNAEGRPETQAGAHPYELTVAFVFKTYENQSPVGAARDVVVELPPGVAGNELAMPQCPSADLAHGAGGTLCPTSTQVGLMRIDVRDIGIERRPLLNMFPENGHTNELGFNAGVVTHIVNSVRTGGDYGIESTTARIFEGIVGGLQASETQVWGVPADPAHDFQRIEESTGSFGHPSTAADVPFLTMPTSCGGPESMRFEIIVDSWENPGRTLPDGGPDLSDPNWKRYVVTDPPLVGCGRLQSFAPDLSIAPDTSYGDTPAGVTVDLKVDQGEGLSSPSALANPDIQDTTVTLPEGLTINPGQAAGLTACESWQDAIGSELAPSCPASSKVGTIEIATPLLPDRLTGNVYILQSDPPHLQLLVAASADGVNLKLVGHVELDPLTGRLTASFDGTPQLPFTDFKMAFSAGAQAALATPPSCGTYATLSDFTPWSSPFTADALAGEAFAITAGPGGSPCASPLPFSPSMIAGSTTDQAGGFTHFSMLLTRGDGQQRIGALQFKTPPGLLGVLRDVTLCGEPQASKGECPQSSRIGETIVGAGPGPFPLYVPQPGAPQAPIYLTGPYKGAPYGLSIAVPVVAGPFNLGTVVVRAAISVDPHTTALTISTDALPQILDGIPTDLRTIDAVINRSGFMFNPTSCAPMSFSGTAQSAQGAQAALASRFQVGSCSSLGFDPKFTASTAGRTSRAAGASLDVKLSYPKAPFGSQANIAKVKVSLPRQLPSRLSTLQKACPDYVFEADPASCPATSRIGFATASTPVLASALSGPAYFVSHGGTRFPELIVVLQGDGVMVQLDGETFINEKTGITSSTFRTIPDVPVETFKLRLPQGPYSALAANGNLCTNTLRMPTVFTAQNGAIIHRTTTIHVTGCPKSRRHRRHTGHRPGGRHHRPRRKARNSAHSSNAGRS